MPAPLRSLPSHLCSCPESVCRCAVFEDDVVLADNFTSMLDAAMDELPDDWDVLMLGALGAVHPLYYACNFAHAMVAGGLRVPRGARQAFSDRKAVAVHEPLRPFGTHAYLISEAGARKLLAAAPKANYHVDVVAWGLRSLRLFAVHPLLAKQTHGDTTIGGMHDRSWLPKFTIDACTRSCNTRAKPYRPLFLPSCKTWTLTAPDVGSVNRGDAQTRVRILRGRGTRR